MERLKMFLVSVFAMCILGPPTGIFLAHVHATHGWYVGVCIFLAGLGVWRAMAPPSAGIRISGIRSKRGSSISDPKPPAA
jgi:hypothetical protein